MESEESDLSKAPKTLAELKALRKACQEAGVEAPVFTINQQPKPFEPQNKTLHEARVANNTQNEDDDCGCYTGDCLATCCCDCFIALLRCGL